MTKGRAAFLLEIGRTDPRSQKPDLGHPSICCRGLVCPLGSKLLPKGLISLHAVGAGSRLGMNDAVAGATVCPYQKQHVLIRRRLLNIFAELFR